ncbi:MAG: hypothetical protein ABI839_07655 [Verrucomicrobiota bacterium]
MNKLLPRIRDVLVLTAEEKRVVGFIVLMILLGVGVKEYRKRHPPVAVPAYLQKDRGMRRLLEDSGRKPDASISASTPRRSKTRSSRGKEKTAPSPTLIPNPSAAPQTENDESEDGQQQQP